MQNIILDAHVNIVFLLLQYYVDSDGTLESVSREEHSLRIILLRWNEVMEEMYAANADSVSKPCCKRGRGFR